MIGAHPDDETLWGGAHMPQIGGYGGLRHSPATTIPHVLRVSVCDAGIGNVGLILSLSGQVARKLDNWNHVAHPDPDRPGKGLMTYQPGRTLLLPTTPKANTDIHHKMTHQIVTALYAMPTSCKLRRSMSLASTTVTAALPDVKDTLTPVSTGGDWRKRRKLFAVRFPGTYDPGRLSHMNPYEMWTQTVEVRQTMA